MRTLEALNNIVNTITILTYPYSKRERRSVTPLEKQLVFYYAARRNESAKKTPLGVRQNMSFLVDVSNLTHWEDVKSDMNGIFPKVLRIGTWTLDIGDESDVQIVAKKKIPLTCDSQMHIHINSKMNGHALCRSLFLLSDKGGSILHNTCLLQYHLADENDSEDLVFDVAPHGNRKHGKKTFYPTQKSTLDAMKAELSENAPSVAFRKVSNASGGMFGAQQPGQLPRSREQLYDLKRKAKTGDQVD